MSPINLIRHSSTPCANIRRVAVRARRTREGILELAYALEGHIAGLRLPDPRPPRHADGLWRHTCCEAFLTGCVLKGYYEFNFAPSMEWAIYRFAAYRDGMSVVEEAGQPTIVLYVGVDRLELKAAVDLNRLSPVLAVGNPRLALTVVIEEMDGRLSYWSLRHPPGQPDFHHPDGFMLALDPDKPASEPPPDRRP